MTPVPDYVSDLRRLVGTRELWLPGVTAVVVREGEVLLTERADTGRWAPVTGIVDPGEEPAVAARREAHEEAGVDIRVDRLTSVGVVPPMTYPNGDRAVYLDLTFACTWLSGDAHAADDENTDVRWWPLDALPPMGRSLQDRIAGVLADETATRFVR